MKEADIQFRTLTQLIQIELTGRLVANGISIPDQFIVQEYEMNTGTIVLRRLFDQHEIALVPNSRLKTNYRFLHHADQFFKEFSFMDDE